MRSLLCILRTLLFLVILVANVEALFFNFTYFDPNIKNIDYGNDSTPTRGAIQLTRNTANADTSFSVGRASYAQPVHLWDKSTKITTNFTTHFSFEMPLVGEPYYMNNQRTGSDGIAFFLAPFNDSTAYAPSDSQGGCLGLVSGSYTGTCNISSPYPFVAVEFDSCLNFWDPNPGHLGIDVNSVVSTKTLNWSGGLTNRTTGNAWITYDSSTNNLSIYLTYDTNPIFHGESSLSQIIDLSSILPERVRVGFSSGAGAATELHNILSWDFYSSLEDTEVSLLSAPSESNTTMRSHRKSKIIKIVGHLAGSCVVIFGLGLVAFLWWRKRHEERMDEIHIDMDDDFDNETGPKRFTYNELSHATNNFSKEGKLGEGGFGGVYRGFLPNLSREIAVKKISRESKQGKKEYVSEVRIISRLRHKNLVQLLGWCHERGDLLLVYEFMPEGSLDSHLYTGQRKTVLPWTLRYKIAQGLASALLYLHEEWEQCVLHRDIKPSNVMLDSSFNAKLGDFGLARLVDHSLGAQTTVLAGTWGYLAPECVITGQASKESDVYSFGVVALEIACGRRPVEYKEDLTESRMIEWVWNLYGEGRLLEAIDKELEDFNTLEIKSLMVVGLWCCHPESSLRPSIKQVTNVLNLESHLPSLDTKFPTPIYCSQPANFDDIYTTSSFGINNDSSSNCTTGSSSKSVASGATPLLH